MAEHSCGSKEVEITMVGRTTMIMLVLIGLIITLAFSLVTCSEDSRDYVYQKWLNTYREVAVLGKKGLNVSVLVEKLSRALTLINEGRLDDALSLIDEVNGDLRVLKEEEEYTLLTKNVYKAVSILLIGSIPVLFYIAFPRLYLEIWFRMRKRWIVKHEST